MLKSQLVETEALLTNEQKKVIELTKKLEQIMQNPTISDRSFKQADKNTFGLDIALAKNLEISYDELQVLESISQGQQISLFIL